ncbi:MAG TPA: hypothetical protein VJ826_09030 [Candidatus Polarisedimenticolaceae bacterium]|nr:hypothetical protein [Candidatus Polarisedimenticolaceae bacterium]
MRPRAPLFLLSLALIRPAAADPWPAEAYTSAVNLTLIEGPAPNDFYEDLSGAFWNAKAKRLWVCRNGPTGTTSKIWALVPNGGGSFQVETRGGNRGEWTGFGDLEDITQVDLEADVLYVIAETEERIKAYDVSTFGTAVLLRDWNVRPHLPLNGGFGAEAIAFVPDRFLIAAGFVGPNGLPYVSTRGMGGLMLVGHQNGGAVYAFDLDPASNAFTFVGEYRTAYDETAALHFDRGNGRLYVWHDEGWDLWEVGDLSSTSIAGSSARQLRAIRTFVGPHNRNNEGLALTSIDECANGVRSAFLTTDDGGAESLTWFKSYAEGCTTLHVGKNAVSGALALDWSGGWAPYTLLRAEDPKLIQGRATILDEEMFDAIDDPVLTDGKNYYYLVP